MNKLFGFLICCLFLGLTWSCDDDNEDGFAPGQITVSLSSKEFRTLENITPFQIPVVLSAPALNEVTVTGYIKSENNAKEGVDYTFMSKRIVIPEGKSVGYFQVDVKDYPEYTPDREFVFELLEAKGAKLSSELDVCKVTITSNEGVPLVGLSETMVTISEEQPLLEVSVRMDRVWNDEVSFHLHTLPEKSTAVYGVHYRVDTTQVYTIQPGDTSLMIPVIIIDDLEENDARYFELALTDCRNAELSEAIRTMKVTIQDDEEPVFVCFDRVSANCLEAEGPIWVPVRIKGNPKMLVRVVLGVREGTAKEGVDFTFGKRDIIFPVGNKLDSVKIDLIDNDVYDVDRSFQVGFDSIQGALIASNDTLMSCLIENDDVNVNSLYDDMIGEYNLECVSVPSGGSPQKLTTTARIYGGETPDQEEENYGRVFMVRFSASGLAYGSDIVLRIRIDVNTGEMQLLASGDLSGANIGYNPPYGSCDLRMMMMNDDDELVEGEMGMTHNRNFTHLESETDVYIYGQLVSRTTWEPFNTWDSNTRFQNLVFTKIK